jgi:hypothetical protein
MDIPESRTVMPRTYWPWPRGSAVFYLVLAFGLFGSHWWPILFGHRKPGLDDFIFPGLYLLSGGGVTIVSFRTFVRLSESSIEVSRLRGARMLPFDKIKGRHGYTERADPYGTPSRHLVLESNDVRFPRIDINECKEFDEAFYRWFDSLPDLDKLDGIEELQSKYANFSLV